MLNNRKELYELAKDYYLRLIGRTAKRYESGEVYTVVDHVGYECTRIEEIFRPMWGIAPFLKDDDFTVVSGGRKIPIRDWITDIISEGTSPESPKRLDRNVNDVNLVGFANQCITEIAAYLITVYFARDVLWTPLSKEKQDRIANWIQYYATIALRKSWPNNHYWYPVFSIEILKKLGYYDPSNDEYLEKAYEELEKLYVGNGWYCDGKDFGRFDYYEAWAHHTYTLLWTLVCNDGSPGREKKCENYRARTSEFLKLYSHYFDCDGGMCAYGRSLSYRFAAVSVFGLAALAGCDVELGLAKSIILRNIDYFFTKSLPSEDGCFGCGYLYTSTRFAENYASDGANTCYTEGFMCLLADEDHPLWRSEALPLHIEKGDYLVECPVDKLDFLVRGEADYDGVTLFNNAMHYFQTTNIAFNDMSGYYSKFCYNSRAGFSLSTRDKAGFDNMISLCTADMAMTSLRGKIYTVSSDKEMLVSYHIPFSNDPETKITTYLLPLSKGYHVRIHKVELSRPYQVREGGFCVGTKDDAYAYANGRLSYGNAVSHIKVYGDQNTYYELQRIHPGMHNLCPMAYYPAWKTVSQLEAGEYVFVSSVFFSDRIITEEEPVISISDNVVKVEFAGKTKTVKL